jgi:HEPN domain-containing protein
MAYPGLSLRAGTEQTEAVTTSLRCPVCRQLGSFHGLRDVHDAGWQQQELQESKKVTFFYQAGVRRCPNTDCNAPVFVVLRQQKLLYSLPPEVLDFDPTGIPDAIKDTLEEAIKCHGTACFKASAIMVRRVLEELCSDRNAKGKNLKERLEALKGTVVIPQELLDAADELRILGNDAAHIEAKEYDNVGREEAEAAIELAKELLKAVYQYAALVSKLRALKKP